VNQKVQTSQGRNDQSERTSMKLHANMPAKKTKPTDAERAKRIRETAREIGTDNDPKSLERAFRKVVLDTRSQLPSATRKACRNMGNYEKRWSKIIGMS
jgi:hypothetical protein